MQDEEINTEDYAPSFAPPERARILGLRRSALLEMALALGIMLLIGWAIGDHTRFWSVNPHPFWFVVLFIGCKYGTREAVVAAVLSSLALLVGNLPEQTMAQDGYAYVLTVLRLPLLWLVSAVAFGELRQMHIRERDRLEHHLMGAEEREHGIASSYQQVKDLKDRLELKMAGQLRSTVAAYHAARTMETLSPAEVYKGLEELIVSSLRPEQFSIFTLNGTLLEVTLTHGWKETDKYPRQFAATSQLYQTIIGKQELLCVANADQEQILGTDGILAGPLVERDSGAVMGMLKIEKMPLRELNLSNIEAFGTICEWAGMTLANAQKYQTAKTDSIVNPDHKLFSQGYFTRYTEHVRALAERVGFDVSMIAIRIVNAERFDDATRARIVRAMSDAVEGVVRKIDLAFDYQENRNEYSIVLPATNRAGAQKALEKIRSNLAGNVDKIARNVDFTMTVQSLYEKRAT